MILTKAKIVSTWLAACGLAFCALAWPLSAEAAKIQYRLKNWNGPPLRVFVTRPVGLAADRPVVFVMHGSGRNAGELRDLWHQLAVENEFMLVVPEFSERDFPGPAAYELGNAFDSKGKAVKEAAWSYTAIEAIFDDLQARFGMTTTAYSLYGHSEGAQFVQRFVFHATGDRLGRAVAANAGWYMMPDFEIGYPYGLQDSRVDEAQLADALQQPLTILIGSEISLLDDPGLRRTPQAMNQGAARQARGQAFFTMAQEAAERAGVAFGWSLQTVDGDGQDSQRTALTALPLLLDE